MIDANSTFDISVRFFDLDINNHVNNSVYFTYMEEARMQLLMTEFFKCKEKGVDIIVAEASCKYRKPIGLQDNIAIKMEVANLKGASFDFIYTFLNKSGEVFAEGKTRMACVDSITHKLVRLPEDILELF